MGHEYKKLMGVLPQVAPDAGFDARVREAVMKIERRHLAYRTTGFGAGALSMAVLLVFITRSAYAALVESGFYQYLSILVTDGLVSQYGRELLMSLAESVPLAAIAGVLAVLGLLVWSLNKLNTFIWIQKTHPLRSLSGSY